MPNDQLLIIFAALVLIGIAVGVAAIIVTLRRPSRTTIIYRDATAEAAESEALPPPAGAAPQPDPLSKYLSHLRRASNCRAVEQLSGQEYLVLMGVWCTAATLELAQMCNNRGEGENYQPTFRLYFNYHDGAWQISDHGANAAALHEIGINVPVELDSIRTRVRNLKATLDQNGVISAQGASYRGFETVIADLCKIAAIMDDHCDPLIWDVAGPLPYALNADGQRHQFTGRGSGNTANPKEMTYSFTLAPGVMALAFEHTGKPKEPGKEGKVQLARDKGGWFDEKGTVFSYDSDHRAVGILRVAEGMWRDPHPDVSYHWEVEAFGKWELNLLQPKLGQSCNKFPYRAGQDGGFQIFGPFRTGPAPVRANVRHDGNGKFSMEFISLDGAHETICEYTGQVHEIDKELELLPGKEYLICGGGNGRWQVELTEGY